MVKEFMCPSDPRSYFSVGSLKSVQTVDQFQVWDWSSYAATLTLAMNSLYWPKEREWMQASSEGCLESPLEIRLVGEKPGYTGWL